MFIVGAAALILLASPSSVGTRAEAGGWGGTSGPETALQKQARMRWWREARFGLFVHWGPVSLKGTEISWSRANTNPKCPNQGEIPAAEYDGLYRRFNPTLFNADDWTGLAKAAGMKYVVLTAKHCDGFCLWPTRTVDYHIGNTPFGRDVCGELSASVHKAGLRLGWYFSPMDWKDPDCRTERNDEFVRRMQGQIRELVGNYGRIDLLWFDWDGGEIPWDQENTYRIVREAQPNIIVNNRLECSFGGHSADSYIGPNADYYTPEQVIGAYDDARPWETCMTLGTQWSWKPNDSIKSVSDVTAILAKCAGGDGNLLLNVGPMPDGRIEPRQAAVLRDVGAWLDRYGDSIYGTRGGPLKPGAWGASTRKGNTVYLHVLSWPSGPLKLNAVGAGVRSWKVLTGGTAKVRQTKAGLEIDASEAARSQKHAVVALTLDRPAESIQARNAGQASGSLATGAKCAASNTYQNDPRYAPAMALDDDVETRWATDSGTKSATLEVDLGRVRTLHRARILEAYPELRRIRRFAIEAKVGDAWVACFSGQEVGKDLTVTLRPTKTRHVRLRVLESLDGPTISEFQVFGR